MRHEARVDEVNILYGVFENVVIAFAAHQHAASCADGATEGFHGLRNGGVRSIGAQEIGVLVDHADRAPAVGHIVATGTASKTAGAASM